MEGTRIETNLRRKKKRNLKKNGINETAYQMYEISGNVLWTQQANCGMQKANIWISTKQKKKAVHCQQKKKRNNNITITRTVNSTDFIVYVLSLWNLTITTEMVLILTDSKKCWSQKNCCRFFQINMVNCEWLNSVNRCGDLFRAKPFVV